MKTENLRSPERLKKQARRPHDRSVNRGYRGHMLQVKAVMLCFYAWDLPLPVRLFSDRGISLRLCTHICHHRGPSANFVGIGRT
jgi:hypothetical protein